MGPVLDREPEGDRHPGGVLRRGEPVLLPRCDGGPDDRVAPRRPRAGRRQALLHLLLDRVQPRAASRRRVLGGQVQGQVRPGVGQAPRGDVRAPEGARRRPCRRGADAARRRLPRMGRRARQAEGVLRAPDGGLRGVLGERRSQRRPRDRCDRGARRARQHGDHLDLGRQRRQHGGHGHGLVQRDDDAERHPADRRDAAAARRALRRHGQVGRPDHGPALRRGVGVGGEHPVPVGQAGRLAPGRHAQPDGHPLAGAHHRGGRIALAVRPRDRRRARRSSTSPASRSRDTVDGIEQEPMHGTSIRRPRSPTRTRPSSGRSSTSRRSATEACTRTAGGSR